MCDLFVIVLIDCLYFISLYQHRAVSARKCNRHQIIDTNIYAGYSSISV